MEQFSINKNCSTLYTGVPLIDISKPDSKMLLVKACEEFGFFKVINHGVPIEYMSNLENKAVNFFSLPLSVKQKAVAPHPFEYGNKMIGSSGDFGWVEYLILTTTSESSRLNFSSIFGEATKNFRSAIMKHDQERLGLI